jgi:hypothetical protein
MRPPRQGRRPLVGDAAFQRALRATLCCVGILAAAACGGGGAGSGGASLPMATPTPPVPTPTPPSTATQYATLGPSSARVTFPAIPPGISATLRFPAGNGSTAAQFTLQSTEPSGPPTLRSGRGTPNLGAPVTAIAYVTATVASWVAFTSTPTITLNAPVGRLTGNVYLAMYDSSSPSAGWFALAGPATAGRTSVTLHSQPLEQTLFSNATYTYAIVQTLHVLPTQTTPMGADYGLIHQCIRSPFPSEGNFFVDRVDCPSTSGAYPDFREWLAIAEIENPYVSGPCVGFNAQSVLINAPGSMITQAWSVNTTAGYSVDFKVDYSKTPNPCQPPTWSFTGIVDNDGFSYAAFPRPDQGTLEYDATYNRAIPYGAGLTHTGAESGFTWYAANRVHVAYSLAIDTWADPGFWNPSGLPTDVFAYNHYYNPSNGFTYYAIVYDGSKLKPALVTQPGIPVHIDIEWGKLLDHAIAEGLAPAPTNGWADSSAFGGEATVGLEIKNETTGPGGPTAELVLSNYRYSGRVPPSNDPLARSRNAQAQPTRRAAFPLGAIKI